MTISIGQKLPEITFKTPGDDGPANITTSELFAGKKAILIGLPGAFTPTCSMNHVPGYLENLETFKSKGVDTIAVVSVNDVFVMAAWAKHTKGEGKIVFLADGNGEFARAIGMDNDFSAAGMGLRSKRYSMLVEDGVVKSVNEETGRGVDVSGAAHMLEQL